MLIAWLFHCHPLLTLTIQFLSKCTSQSGATESFSQQMNKIIVLGDMRYKDIDRTSPSLSSANKCCIALTHSLDLEKVRGIFKRFVHDNDEEVVQTTCFLITLSVSDFIQVRIKEARFSLATVLNFSDYCKKNYVFIYIMFLSYSMN